MFNHYLIRTCPPPGALGLQVTMNGTEPAVPFRAGASASGLQPISSTVAEHDEHQPNSIIPAAQPNSQPATGTTAGRIVRPETSRGARAGRKPGQKKYSEFEIELRGKILRDRKAKEHGSGDVPHDAYLSAGDTLIDSLCQAKDRAQNG